MDGVVKLLFDAGYRSRQTYDNLGKDDLNDLYYVCDFCSNDSSRGYFVESTTPATGQSPKASLLGKLGSMAKGAAGVVEGFADGAADAFLGGNDAAYLIPTEEYTNETWGGCAITKSIDWITLMRYVLLPAGLIITLLSFLLQRRQLGTQCCSGRPGLIYPVNLIDNQKHRLTYVAAFTLTSYQMLMMVFNGPPFYPWETAPTRDMFPYPTWIVMPTTRALFLAIGCIQYAFIYYPLFATLSSHHVLGYIMGTLYMWGLAAMFFLSPNLCTQVKKDMLAFNYLSVAPCGICVVYLSIVFPFRVVQSIWLCRNGKAMGEPFTVAKSMAETRYVKDLMRRNKLPQQIGKPPILQRIRDAIYMITPGFKYSPSVLTGAAMAISFSWMVFIWALQSFYIVWLKFDKHLKPAVIAANGGMSWKNKEILVWDIVIYLMDLIHNGQCTPWIKRVIYFLDSLKNCYIAACVLAYINIVVCVLLAVRNYKINMLLIYQGRQKDVHPATDYSPATLLLSAARYVGFQTAYSIWGLVIQGWLLVLGFVTASACMNLLCPDTLIFLLKVCLQYFWVAIAVVVIIFLTQYLMGRFLFLLKNEKGQTVLALDNRRLYFNFNYFAIFSNTALGVISCLIRILKSIGLGLYILPRLDMSALNRHFEWLDTSFMSFVGLLYLENAHRNPIMLVAVGYFLEGHTKRRNSPSKIFAVTEKNMKNSPHHREKIARNRWRLAWTLYNNPGLRLHRKLTVITSIRSSHMEKQPVSKEVEANNKIPIPQDLYKGQVEMRFIQERRNLRVTAPRELIWS